MRDTISQLCNLMVHTKASTCMRIWSNLRSAGHGGDDMHANLANPELLDCLTVQSDTKAENLVLRSTVVARFSSVVRAVRRRTAAPQPAHTRLRGSSTHARERRTTAAAPNASLARPLSRALARLARVAGALSQHAVVPTAHGTNAPSPQATDHDQCHQQPKCGYKSKHEQGRSANDCSYDRR